MQQTDEIQDEEIETTLFEIITQVGTARSLYIEATQAARAGDAPKAKEMIAQGAKAFNEGHSIHSELIRKVYSEGHEPVFQNDGRVMLLTHAEDQLMSAEAFGILAEEFVALYELLGSKGVLS